jgi:hypothetical protein
MYSLFLSALLALSQKSSAAATAPAAIPAVAARLIPAYAGAHSAGDLTTLLRLQLAAGRFDEAQRTLDRLEAAYRATEPRLIPTVTPWRIYTRAKLYEAQGRPASAALASAFAELYGALPDKQAAAIRECVTTATEQALKRITRPENWGIHKNIFSEHMGKFSDFFRPPASVFWQRIFRKKHSFTIWHNSKHPDALSLYIYRYEMIVPFLSH